MSYDEAYDLNRGDKVTIENTKERRIVEEINGTLTHLFILLDNGREYRHDQLIKS